MKNGIVVLGSNVIYFIGIMTSIYQFLLVAMADRTQNFIYAFLFGIGIFVVLGMLEIHWYLAKKKMVK